MNDKSNQNYEEFECLLADHQQKLLNSLDHEQNDSADVVELDQSRMGRLSRMDALQAQEMSKERIRRTKTQLLKISTALDRLDEGDFGYCVECGVDIPLARLKIDPTVQLCINCASAMEVR